MIKLLTSLVLLLACLSQAAPAQCAPACIGQTIGAHSRNALNTPSGTGVRVNGGAVGKTCYVRWLPNTDRTVTGFDLRIRSNSGSFVTWAELYSARANGTPELLSETIGAIGIEPGFEWRRANFFLPFRVTGNNLYFVSFDVPAGMSVDVEVCTTAGTIFAVSYFIADIFTSVTGSPTNDRIMYRINTDGDCPWSESFEAVPAQTANFRCHEIPGQRTAVLWLGLSSTAWQGGSLPMSWAPFGALGSFLCISPDALVGITSANVAGTATVAVPMPNSPALSGLTFYSQWLIATGNSAGFVLSDYAIH